MAPPPKSISYPTYHVTLGLSLIATATIILYSFSASLSTSRATALEAPLYPAPHAYSDTLLSSSISQATPYQTQSGPPITLAELANLMSSLERQIHELKAFSAQHASIVTNCKNQNVALEDEVKVALNILTVLLCVVTKVGGLTILGTALIRISETQWYRTASFAVIGANLGFVAALWGLPASTLDQLVVFSMVGIDIGTIIGGLLIWQME